MKLRTLHKRRKRHKTPASKFGFALPRWACFLSASPMKLMTPDGQEIKITSAPIGILGAETVGEKK